MRNRRFLLLLLPSQLIVTPHAPSPPGFVTGLDRVPYTGMEGVRMSVDVLPAASDAIMPQSFTCYLRLLLPVYQQNPAETMRSKLLQAINHKRGFTTQDAAGGRSPDS